MPRQTWLDRSTDILLDEIGKYKGVVSREDASAFISAELSDTAARLGVADTSARRYLTEDVIRGLAREIVFGLAHEQPGAHMLDLDRDCAVSVQLLGRTIA